MPSPDGGYGAATKTATQGWNISGAREASFFEGLGELQLAHGPLSDGAMEADAGSAEAVAPANLD